MTMSATMPQEGDAAPDFTLPRNGGGSVTLSSLRPRKVVVYFYPKDDTPGCTLEALDFTRLAPEFEAAGTTVIGISRDSVAGHDRFCAKHGLGVTLASDEGGAVCTAWGVLAEKTLYGRKSIGIVRSTFLVDAAGRVARCWSPVRVEGHADEVLAAARGL